MLCYWILIYISSILYFSNTTKEITDQRLATHDIQVAELASSLMIEIQMYKSSKIRIETASSSKVLKNTDVLKIPEHRAQLFERHLALTQD